MFLNKKTRPDIIVFLDGDYSDYPEELPKLTNPIINDDIDFVVGARTKLLREKGSYDKTSNIWELVSN